MQLLYNAVINISVIPTTDRSDDLPETGTEPAAASPIDRRSRRLAGILLISIPTIAFGGASLLTLIINSDEFVDNELRQRLWAAGHGHAGVLLLLSLITLRYVDETTLSEPWREVARHGAPLAAIFMPLGFFLSVLDPGATEPNFMIWSTYFGAVVLGVGMSTLGIGLVRIPRSNAHPSSLRSPHDLHSPT